MKKILALLFMVLLNTGCYWNWTVSASESGVKLDGGRIVECVGPGVQTDFGWFATLDRISHDTITQEVKDAEVVTVDKQPVSVIVTLQYQRKNDCDSLKGMLAKWPGIAKDNTAMIKTMDSIVSQGIKVAVSQFSLNQLLEDRNSLALTIKKDLEQYTNNFYVAVISVGVKDVGVDPAYLATLKTKAQYTVQVEAEIKRQEVIKQQALNAQLQAEQDALVAVKQLAVEQAKTQVQLEIATRDGRITQAQNSVYQTNPQAYELQKLKLLKDILGEKSVLYFIPQGTDINVLLGQFAGGTPVITK